ncbi:MAG: PQQ-dependent sugar dehydrogenase [Pirellulales bacterium]|nr:PQQ-dependent sugar dehydrogenase [Pirellulales bacterium]
MNRRPAPAARIVQMLSAAAIVATTVAARAELTLRLQDFAAAPMTGSVAYPSATANSAYLARLNFLADDPLSSDRMFVNDLNGPLYILDKQSKEFTEYLNFNGRGSAAGIFPRLYTEAGYATGLVSFQFDPDYANNGKFYTIHIEQGGASTSPDASSFPGFNTAGYTTTSSINAPGYTAANGFHNVLVEWTDTNPHNSVFEGTARELFRIGQRTRIHPMGDISFNPNANPGDPDWRMMYVSIGDGGNGESSSVRNTPQQLDNLAGKVVRIRPDNVDAGTSLTASPNGRYFIPADNPFTSLPQSAVRDEIYALGLRNPHRMTWDAESGQLIVNDIGLYSWEEVNLIHSGGNYGYPAREGNEQLDNFYGRAPIPAPDQVTYYLNSSTPLGTTTPLYPVVQYGHGLSGQGLPVGDAISSGFVYRGTNIPSLQGKFIFGDITTGQLMWADYDDVLAADDGNPATLATIHSIDLLWEAPGESGEQFFTMLTTGGATRGPLHQIIEIAYHDRGGLDPNLPGGAQTTGSYGRADIRLQVDADGELYILSKSDGMMRRIVEAVGTADFDGDGAVDGRDFLIWQRNAGAAGGLAQGDADGDGRIGAADLGFWNQQYAPAASSATTVPEPGSLVAALLGGATLGFMRRRVTGKRSEGFGHDDETPQSGQEPHLDQRHVVLQAD